MGETYSFEWFNMVMRNLPQLEVDIVSVDFIVFPSKLFEGRGEAAVVKKTLVVESLGARLALEYAHCQV